LHEKLADKTVAIAQETTFCNDLGARLTVSCWGQSRRCWPKGCLICGWFCQSKKWSAPGRAEKPNQSL